MAIVSFIPIILLVVAGVQALLKVQSNDQLLKKLQSRGPDFEFLNYSLAHFGVVPYGTSILGYLHYDLKNEDGCKKSKLEPYNEDDLMPILVVKRGGCEFVEKARRAQLAGAAMLLIVDDKKENISLLVPVALHDGTRSKIPTLIVEKEGGDSIIEVLSDGDPNVSQSVVVQFKMDIEKSDVAEINFVLGITDKLGYEFLTSFKDMISAIDEDMIKINYSFFYDKCEDCKPETLKDHCLNTLGTECLFTFDKGREGVETVLLHTCALTIDSFKKSYMDFSERYKEECLSGKISEDKLFNCSLTLIEVFAPGTSSEIRECVKYNRPNASILLPNTLFLKNSKIKEYPLAIINNMSIEGSMSAENIFQSLCFSYKTPPESCMFLNGKYTYSPKLLDMIKSNKSEKGSFVVLNLFVIILIFAIAGFLFYYIFKRTYRRLIQVRVDDMIKDSITKYKRMGQTESEI